MAQQIVALGGGGFSMEPHNLALDRYILSLTKKDRPKVCFMPQASGESPLYVRRFYDAYTHLNTDASWFSLFEPVHNDWRDYLLEQDVLFVGGGNTKSMIALWQAWGVVDVLKEALENGTVLAGVSAGAICWFEQCVTDSVWPLGIIEGLGFLQGSSCPHYDGEAERRPAVHQMLTNGDLIAGIAINDYAAAHYIDGELHKVVTSRATAKAFLVSSQDGTAQETELETEFLEN